MSDYSKKVDVTTPRPEPNRRWVCGYERIGLACAEGPSENGVCCQNRPGRVPAPVAPSERSAVCERNCSCATHCQLAGLRKHPQLPSHHELGPCVPQRTAWFSRQTIALNVAILTAGILLLCMALPQRESVFVPGVLTQKHSQILGNRLVSERCSLCHPNSHTREAGLHFQDELCMRCHESHMSDASLRSPHDLTASQLQSLGGIWKHNAVGASEVGLPVAKKIADRETSCATCHKEHHGATFDLTSLSDASCQACHQVQFASLSQGHPEFENYPYRTNRRLAFDHAAHEQMHFATKGQEFSCAVCHVDQHKSGEVGSVFRTVGFETACGNCHNQAIKAASVNGWAVLQTPSIEGAAATEPQSVLSDWPATARFGFEGEISVVARILLLQDSDAAQALRELPKPGKLQDIRDPLARRRVGRLLAAGFRRLVADVASRGQAAWKERLIYAAETTFGRKLFAAEERMITELSAGLPPDLFRQMEAQWFGGPSSIAEKNFSPRNAPFSNAAGPFHTVSASDESLPENSDLLAPKPAQDLSSDDELLLGTDDELLSGEELLGESGVLGNQSDSTASSGMAKLRASVHVVAGGWYLDSELLTLYYMPRGHADRTLAAWTEFVARLDSAASRAPMQEDASSWGDPVSREGHGALRWDAGQVVPGGCTQCHLLEQHPVLAQPPVPIAQHRSEAVPASDAWSSWKSVARPHGVRPFTKFDHSPHLTLPSLSDCRFCHVSAERSEDSLTKDRDSLGKVWERLQEDTPSADWQLRRDAACQYLDAEFSSMNLGQCSACHRAGGASQACTQCHNYHVGSEGLDWSQSHRPGLR